MEIGGRPGLPVPISPYGLCGRKAILKKKSKMSSLTELRSCVKVEIGGHPGLPVPISPYGLCGRKATLKKKKGSGTV